jgi:hypothetical protein
MTVGDAEGDTCGRGGCSGEIQQDPTENCSCHINPPCSACTSPREFCDTCDWRAEDDDAYVPAPSAPDCPRGDLRDTHLTPLDTTRIDYRCSSHSGCSMRKVGVFPYGTDKKALKKQLDGSFGGRFEAFKDATETSHGTFNFIAQTD